jgi:hypothetical protein
MNFAFAILVSLNLPRSTAGQKRACLNISKKTGNKYGSLTPWRVKTAKAFPIAAALKVRLLK